MRVAVRAALAALVSVLMLLCARESLRAGASRVVSDYAVRALFPAAADEAIALAPADPEAHYAKANLLADAGKYSESARVYREALALRPRDYVIWVELGKASEEAGDAVGALAAFREARALAPFYARPRWQLGNALLRAGRKQEALEELRRAAHSDHRLFPNFLQTLWHVVGKDPHALKREAQPQTPLQTLALVRFLIKSAEAGEGMSVLRESGASVSAESRRAILVDLLAADSFEEAYEIWSAGRDAVGVGGGARRGALTDGGFEEPARTDEEGFGWRFAREAVGLRFSLDADSPRQGSRSLRVEFAGGSDPASAAISQLILIEPGARYRLKFSARTRDLVTGGLPYIEILSAGKEGAGLAESPPLKPESFVWRDYAVEFTAPAQTKAVRLALRRQPCSGSPCPAFGSLWLDSFELDKI